MLVALALELTWKISFIDVIPLNPNGKDATLYNILMIYSTCILRISGGRVTLESQTTMARQCDIYRVQHCGGSAAP